jgi:alanine racemase
MVYSIQHIISAIGPEKYNVKNPQYSEITWLCLDSRHVFSPKETLYFALKGDQHDGHDFISEVYHKGVRNFVVETDYEIKEYFKDCNVILVKNSLTALQKLAAFHRNSFKNLLCIGITGSNGKTTVKEWLGMMLTQNRVVRSPKSYNSQTGVPLSLWLIDESYDTGIFEAGISKNGEMDSLANMIQPEIGILTNIGEAHASGFQSMIQKLEEKMKLFKSCKAIIFPADDGLISERMEKIFPKKKKISWGRDGNFLKWTGTEKKENKSVLFLEKDKIPFSLELPFTNEASLQNVLSCVTLLLYLDYTTEEIQKNIRMLHNLDMRLELKQGEQNSILINDTYNADIQSFTIALEFLGQNAQNRKKIVFLTSFEQTGLETKVLMQRIANLLTDAQINEIHAIGKEIQTLHIYLHENAQFFYYETTEEVLNSLEKISIRDAAVLVKGSRKYGLERLSNVLSQKRHEAVLETDLQAVGQNLRFYSSCLAPRTGKIAVIKASAYGSGSHELATFLEHSKIDYIAVAYVDEGVDLRQKGITTPVMVLNSSAEQWQECMRWDLEPEVYSLDFMNKLQTFEGEKSLKIHLKLDTGMFRLGLLQEDIPEAKKIISQWPVNIIIASVFTHLVSSEMPEHDKYTHEQVKSYLEMYDVLSQGLSYKPKKHVLNTAGILRFPEYHFDFVRIGLGLYGIDVSNSFAGKLEKVHTLKARILQIKNVKKSDRIGYNRKGSVMHDGRIAVINIGYADGLMRMAGNGNFLIKIGQKLYPVVGNVNMDLTIVDIGNNTDIQVGDEVEIFGKHVPVEKLAEACKTIPYEILTRIAPRVKRVYIKG